MLYIQKKMIRELKSNLPSALLNKSLTLALPVTDNAAALKKIGFDESPKTGDTILPSAIGSKTKFNAYGLDKVRRDLEKETVYRSALWTREQWAGRGETRTVTDIVYRSYKRYPREHIDGPELELTIAEKDGQQYVSLLNPITYNDANNDLLKLGMNIFLEAFGKVVIYDESLEPINIPANLKSLNWRILPPGKKITKEELETALKAATSRPKGVRAAEIARQEMLYGYGPTLMAVGQGGLTGYVAYVFEDKKLTLLESIHYGNATYLLNASDWEKLSKLTKHELISQKLAIGREIHSKNWVERIKSILGR